MIPAQEAWKAAVNASLVLAQVEARLIAAGALIELRQLQGLSAKEQDVLVFREVHSPVHIEEPLSPPGCPHATDGTVAA